MHAGLEGPQWTFALRCYGQPGIADACLLLQDRLGVDINMLLFAAYAAIERGIAVDARDLRSMDDLVAPWRNEIVVALRKIRRRMRTGPRPAPSEVTERLRTQVKAAELHAEQIEQAALARWLDRHAGNRPSSQVDVGNVLQTVVAYFANARGLSAEVAGDAEIRHTIEALVDVLASPRRRA